VVVETRSRAAALRLGYAWDRSQQASVWPTPLVSSLAGWQSALAIAELRDGAGPGVRPLDALEEWTLWRAAAQRRLAARDDTRLFALSADRLADLLAGAARLLGDWGISASDLARADGVEAGWLLQSLLELRERAAAREASLACDLPQNLLDGSLQTAHSHYLTGALPRQIEKLLHAKGVRPLQLSDAARGVGARVRACADPLEEFAAAANWARSRLERDPQARLYIVVPRLAHYRDDVARIFDEALTPRRIVDPNIEAATDMEGGQPLARYAVPALRLSILAALTGRTSTSEFARLLESAAFADQDRAARARLAATLRADAVRRLGMAEWLSVLARVTCRVPGDEAVLQVIRERLLRAHRLLSGDGVGSAGAASWAARLQESLGALAQGGAPAANSAQQQVDEQWQRFIEQFAAAERWQRSESANAAVGLLSAMAERQYFAPSRGEVPVTITRTLDHPVVYYDGIWVCGLQSDTWPAAQRWDPFVPWSLQRAAGIPAASSRGQSELARAAMQRWASATDELVYSFAHHDGETELQPSALLAELPPLEQGTFISLAARMRVTSEPLVEQIDDVRGLPWPEDLPLPGGANALIDQDACGFRAYANRRLLGREDDEAEHGISALTRGSFLHRVLQHLWGALGDSARLARLDEEALAGTLQQALELAVDELLAPEQQDSARRRIIEREQRRAARIIRVLLDNERLRPAFEVILREHEVKPRLGQAQLALRIDRVDRILSANGTHALAVIDYKSGKHRSVVFGGERIEAIQLWLYAIALESIETLPVAALANLHLASAGPRYVGLATHAQWLPELAVSDEWSSWREQARLRLTELAAEFLAGFAQVQPSRRACEHCELAGLCRRSSISLEADAPGEQ